MDDPLARAIAAHGGFDRSNKFNNKVTLPSCAPQAGGRKGLEPDLSHPLARAKSSEK